MNPSSPDIVIGQGPRKVIALNGWFGHAGANDPALGEAICKATWLVHYPNATLEVMANAGHYPMDETPVALASAIESFLKAKVQS